MYEHLETEYSIIVHKQKNVTIFNHLQKILAITIAERRSCNFPK